MKAFADLYAALDETTKTDREGRGAGPLLRRRRPGRRGLGRLLPQRPQAPAGRAVQAAAALGGRGGRRPRVAVRRELPPVGDVAETIALLAAAADARRPTGRCADWVEDGGCCRCATLPEDGAEGGRARGLGGARRAAAVRLEQAHHRRVPRRRVAAAGDAGAWPRWRASSRRGRAPAHGRLGADAGLLTPRSSAAGRRRRRPQPAVPVLPGPPARRRPGRARRRRRLAGRVEVGRHPRAAGPPRRARRSSGRAARSWSPTATRSWRPLADALPDGTVHRRRDPAVEAGQVLPFAELQRRIGRKTHRQEALAEVPVVLMAYDLLEAGGRGPARRGRWPSGRRLLEAAGRRGRRSGRCVLSPRHRGRRRGTSWRVRGAASRERHVEGLMLKRRDSPYRVGRVRGDWWKWKVEPFTVDAVLIYAQRGTASGPACTPTTRSACGTRRQAGAVRQGVLAA